MQVYEVFTKLSMVNNVSGVLAAVSKEVLTLEIGVNKLQAAFTNLNRTALAVGGGLAMFGGVTVLEGLAKITSHSDKLLDQQDKLQRAGMSLNEILKLQGDYYARIAKSVPTSNAADYLRTFNELRSVVGADAAAAKTPWALKLESLMQNMTGKSAEGEGFKILRALEMKGITLSDPAMSDKLADIMVKNIIGSGGKLTAEDFQAMAKRGGVAWQKASPEFIAGPLSNIASDLGGQSTGTALMTLYQLMSGATQMSDQQARELHKLGLLRPGMWHVNEKSGKLVADPGAILGSDIGMSDPSRWVQEIVLPRMKEAYGGDETAMAQSFAIIGRNRNAQRMLMMFSDPGFREQMEKDYALWRQAHSVDRSYDDAVTRNPKMVKAAFHGQYESMMQAIGAPLMQAAIPVMKAVTEMFTKFGDFANKNPETIKQIGTGIAILGAALVGGGAVALLAALGPAGWIAAGITALGGAVLAFPRGLLDQIGAKISAFADTVASKFNALLEFMRSWGEAFGKWLSGLRDKLFGWLGGLFSKTGFEGGGMDGGGIVNASYGGAATGVVGGGGDIVSLGRRLQAQGYNISEHPAFGGVHPVHHGAGHYEGRAIDVNVGRGVFEAGNPAAARRFDALASRLRGEGYKVIWRAPGHYNHMHVETPRGVHPSRFSPPAKSRGHSGGEMVVLNVDGETLGRIASKHIARHHEHSRQAPYFNGRAMYAGTDVKFAVG